MTIEGGRRNLDGYQRTRLALRLEDTIKARAKANQSGGQGGVLLKQNSAEANGHVETREELAKLAGVSRDTVDKARAIEKKATPEMMRDEGASTRRASARARRLQDNRGRKPSRAMQEPTAGTSAGPRAGQDQGQE